MKKAQLTINDIPESGFKILEVLNNRMMVSQIAIKTGLGVTTIRRLLQRLEVFGLVNEELIDQAKHFSLTKDGKTFVKRTIKARDELKPEPVEPKAIPVVAPIQHEPFNLAEWLRQKAQGLRGLADELNAMADDLAHYEE